MFLQSQVIENLDTLSSLQSLFLGTNKITKLQNLEGLHNLTVLSIQVISHVIFKTCLSGFKNTESSSACKLKHSLIILLNVICRVTGSLKSRVCRTSSTSKSSTWATMASRSLRAWKTMWVIETQCISEALHAKQPTPFACMPSKTSAAHSNTVCLPSQKKLTTLDIAANRIKKIENVSHLTDLQEFWVRTILGCWRGISLNGLWVQVSPAAFTPCVLPGAAVSHRASSHVVSALELLPIIRSVITRMIVPWRHVKCDVTGQPLSPGTARHGPVAGFDTRPWRHSLDTPGMTSPFSFPFSICFNIM